MPLFIPSVPILSLLVKYGIGVIILAIIFALLYRATRSQRTIVLPQPDVQGTSATM